MMKTENSRKESSFPLDIKLRLDEVAFSASDLVGFVDETLFAVVWDSGSEVLVTACPILHELPYWATYYDYPTIPADAKKEDVLLMAISVQDPESLPFDLAHWQSVAVVCEDWQFATFDNMEEATKDIEFLMRNFPKMDIEDFTVFVFTELNEAMKKGLLERMEHYRKTKGRND